MKNHIIRKLASFMSIILVMSAAMTGCGNDSNKAAEVSIERKPEQVKEDVVEVEEVNETAEEQVPVQEEVKEVSYVDLYKEAIENFVLTKGNSEEDLSKYRFDLIYFDEDDVPELVMGKRGYYVDLYTVIDGQIVVIIDNWAYGAGGNAGYDYLEKQGIVYNSNSDSAGAEEYETYWKWDAKAKNLENAYDEELCMRYVYYDINGDGITDFTDILEGGLTDEVLYFYGDENITYEEYLKYTFPGEYKPICGEMTYDDIMSKLN